MQNYYSPKKYKNPSPKRANPGIELYQRDNYASIPEDEEQYPEFKNSFMRENTAYAKKFGNTKVDWKFQERENPFGDDEMDDEYRQKLEMHRLQRNFSPRRYRGYGYPHQHGRYVHNFGKPGHQHGAYTYSQQGYDH